MALPTELALVEESSAPVGEEVVELERTPPLQSANDVEWEFCYSMLCPRLFSPDDCNGAACLFEEQRSTIHIYAITPDDDAVLVAVQPRRLLQRRTKPRRY